MRFSTKVFLAIFLPALSLMLGISAAFYAFLARATRAQFVMHYQSVTRQVAHTLSQLEATTDLLLAAGVRVLAERVHQAGPLPTEALQQLSQELGVANFYIIRKDGVFLRTTGEDPATLPNAFSFCTAYRRMFATGTPFVPTGLMPGIPELTPYKFLFLPSSDRQYLLEAGVRADFIGSTLRQTLSADSELISLALYAPNGSSLGEFSADGRFSYERSLAPSSTFTTKTSLASGRFQLTERVAATNRECCSCRRRGLIGEGDYHYYLRTLVSTRSLDEALRRLTWITALLLSVGLVLSLLLSRWLSRRLVSRIDLINEQAHTIMRTGDLTRRTSLHDKDEVGRLSAQFDEMLAALQVKQGELIRLEHARVAVETAEHVAHDIRSPLAALDMLLKLSPAVPEGQRVLLRTAVNRIREIASNLLDQSRQIRGTTLSDPTGEANASAVVPEAVWSLLETLLPEKQHQYRPRAGVVIELLQPELAYPLFVAVNANLFRRALSNLIDNAVEAIETTGRVEITASQHEGRVRLEVRDTGRGIPPAVLPTLMEKGRTYGKPHGSGLGLYTARQSLRAWNGDLQISSSIGQGSKVIMVLPAVAPPKWFAPEILVPADATVVIADDDESIHEVWRTRFADLAASEQQVRLLHYSSMAELRQFYRPRATALSPMVFLVDYEFHGEDGSGLDCIAELGIAASSILVTSHTEDVVVRERCVDMKIVLLPKSVASFVKIRIGADHLE